MDFGRRIYQFCSGKKIKDISGARPQIALNSLEIILNGTFWFSVGRFTLYVPFPYCHHYGLSVHASVFYRTSVVMPVFWQQQKKSPCSLLSTIIIQIVWKIYSHYASFQCLNERKLQVKCNFGQLSHRYIILNSMIIRKFKQTISSRR